MRKVMMVAALATLLGGASLQGAQARGCLRGAVIGGVAGHLAGHHALVGAAAGCVISHHMAHQADKRAYYDRHRLRR
jgi:hypothetical protein